MFIQTQVHRQTRQTKAVVFQRIQDQEEGLFCLDILINGKVPGSAVFNYTGEGFEIDRNTYTFEKYERFQPVNLSDLVFPVMPENLQEMAEADAREEKRMERLAQILTEKTK